MRALMICLSLIFFSQMLYAGTPGVSGLESITIASMWLLLFILSIKNTVLFIKESRRH